VVQALLSVHVVPLGLFVAAQPVVGLHVPAFLHALAVHVTAVPPEHTPDWQASPVVHALLSLQVVPFGLLTAAGQPVAGTQAPMV
jgi:hypothetical protein